MHTEINSTYTMISIQKQANYVKKKAKYEFVFILTNKHNVSIRLTERILVIFSGKLLTHRQSSNLPYTMKDKLFINFASYGTQRFLTHIKNTFVRKHKN